MVFNQKYRAKNLNRRSVKPTFIVLHDTAGSGELGDVTYLATDPEGRGVSVDFVVPKSGEVFQLNPDLEKYYTNHAGRNTKFRDFYNRDVNIHSIGIEIAQKANINSLPDPKYPEVQINAVASLCATLCGLFSLTRNDITTHSQIITDGSRSDPRQFPWNEFWDKFTYYSEGDLLQHDGTIYTVVKGDTLWSLAIRFATTVEHLKALNNMNSASTMIQQGQRLVIK